MEQKTKYKKGLVTKVGNFWECELHVWKGCYCSKETVIVLVEQDRSPTLKDIVLTYSAQHSIQKL